MIKIHFVPPSSPAWQSWCSQAEAEHRRLLKAHARGRAITFKESLYKRCRAEIFDAAYTKCAYCEAMVLLDQTGDVEHYRPKGKVTDENDREVMIGKGRSRSPHPGYFWLAYDWRNLLPSCARCNRPVKGPDGKLVGKWNRFPVKGDQYATKPSGVAAEVPLLINPVTEDPADHLDMDAATGILFGKTQKGNTTIRLLGLNREGLPEARRDTYDNVLVRASDIASAARHLDFILRHKKGQAEYSLAGRKALSVVRTILQAQLDALSPRERAERPREARALG